MPGRHSLFWKLAVAMVTLCISLIWLSWTWGRQVERDHRYLPREVRAVLQGYAREAERAWLSAGADGVDEWLAQMRAQEDGWLAIVDGQLQPLGNQPLSRAETSYLTFLRGLDWPMNMRTNRPAYIGIPFPGHPAEGRLVMELPARFKPGGVPPLLRMLTHGLVPGLVALLVCVVFYRQLIQPLGRLRERANALRGGDLDSPDDRNVSRRRDELGELARAYDHMAERLRGNVTFQRQLLRDLSHEVRTPLSRLRVAAESDLPVEDLRQRLERDVEVMQRLVENALELAWMDAERPRLPMEDISVVALWDLLVEDACFETGWPVQRFSHDLPEDCLVRGHLNGLAKALENLLRNAIRHSPENGCIHLAAQEEEGFWRLCLTDQGPGVAEADLERIFLPFTRLEDARSSEGFGLGLSIARSAIRLQDGELWAERGNPGLRACMRLPRAVVA